MGRRCEDALTVRTWYDDTAVAPLKTGTPASATGDFDVAVIGGGLAGLAATLRLAQSGARVVLLEGVGIGAGASGRNGGFCSPGWAADERRMRRIAGPAAAQTLMRQARAGVEWMRARMELPAYAPTRPVDGILTVSLSGRAPERVAKGERLVPGSELLALLNAPRYRHAVLSPEAFHFHPLNFMRLLAAECRSAGALLLQGAPLRGRGRAGSTFRLEIAGRSSPVSARQIILATGGYGGKAIPPLERHLLAIRTYIGVTDPMPEVLDQHIRTGWAVGDTRRAGNYYRRLHDGRLLWGMGITAFGTLRVGAVGAMVARDIASVYPSLAADMRAAGKALAYAWAGNMAYAPHFLPYVGEISPGVFALTGFGGHGMNTAPVAAMALADHLSGRNPEALAPFEAIPMRRSFGSAGRLAAEGAYRALRLADWAAERMM